MKNIIVFLTLISSLFSCGNASEEPISTTSTLDPKETVKADPVPTKEAVSNNILCQINGEDWAYTKASGIVSTHARSGAHTALFTFTKKLKKGSESIQLYYDADSFELITVSIMLKSQNKSGQLFTSYYDLKPGTRKRNPQGKMSGKIDLSNPTSASGIAEIENLNIIYEKENLLNAEDAVISITNLKFSGIGYSDTDKLVKSFTK